MKKGVLILFLVGIMLIGCSKGQETGETGNFRSDEKYLYLSNIVAADDGAYFIDRKAGYDVLKYVDKESGRAAVLCQNVNCRHDSDECQAVIEEPAMICCIVYADGYLYSLENSPQMKMDDEGKQPIYLYRRNKDGTGKTLLHEFWEGINLPNGGGIYRGKFIISIQAVVNYEDGTGTTGGATSLILYDMKTKEETKIVDGYESPNQFSQACGGIDDAIYYYESPFSLNGTNGTDVDTEQYVFRKYDFETETVSELWRGKESDVQLIKNDEMYFKADGEQKIELHHFDTDERETVFEWKEDVDDAYIGEGYIRFVRETEQDGGIVKSYKWYDLESGKFLFDEYLPDRTIRVRKLEGIGYWIETESEWYLYRPETDTRIDIEEL